MAQAGVGEVKELNRKGLHWSPQDGEPKKRKQSFRICFESQENEEIALNIFPI